MKHSLFDATISALDAETLATHGVIGGIGDCGVGVTQEMCNRVTNHGDMGTFYCFVGIVPIFIFLESSR